MMRRFGLWLAAGLIAGMGLAAPIADAATTYVAAGNRPGTTGTSKSDAWGSTFIANATVAGGDVVRILPGQYAGVDSLIIRPAASQTGGTVIQYNGVTADGSTDNSTGSVVINGNLTLDTPYTYLSNVHITGNLALGENADRCRLINVIIDGNTDLRGCDYTTLDGCTFRGPFLTISRSGGGSKRDSIINSTFSGLGYGITADGANYPIMCGSDDGPLPVDSCVVYNNTIASCALVPVTGTANGEFWTEVFWHTTNLQWVANHETVNCPANARWTRRFRDATNHITVERDTITFTGAGSAQFMVSSYGAGDGPVGNVKIDSCSYQAFGATGGGDFLYFQNGAYNDQVTYTTVESNGRCILNYTAAGHNLIQHNTFVGAGGGGVIRHEPFSGLPAYGDSSWIQRDNIIALLAPWPQQQALGYPLPGYGTTTGLRVCEYWTQATLDSAGKGRLQRSVFSDHNLYSNWSSTSTAGDDDILIWGGNGYEKNGTVGNNTPTENAYGLDSVAVAGSCQFDSGGPDSLANANFDPTPGPQFAGVAAGNGGSDIGAITYTPVCGSITVVTPAIYFNPGAAGDYYFSYFDNSPSSNNYAVLTTGTPTFTNTHVTLSTKGVPPNRIDINLSSFKIHYDGIGGAFLAYMTFTTNDCTQPLITIPIYVGTPVGTQQATP